MRKLYNDINNFKCILIVIKICISAICMFNSKLEKYINEIFRNSHIDTVIIILYSAIIQLILHLHGFYEKEYLIPVCRIMKLRRLRKLPACSLSRLLCTLHTDIVYLQFRDGER